MTPSRTKIAQTTEDLVSYAEAAADQVQPILNQLTDNQDSRILRRLANPERYEIFHDVLALPILEWRRQYLTAIEQQAAEKVRQEEAARRIKEVEFEETRKREKQQATAARRFKRLAGVLAVIFVLAVAAAGIAVQQSNRARVSAASEALLRANAEEAALRAQQQVAVTQKQLEDFLNTASNNEHDSKAEKEKLQAALDEVSKLRSQINSLANIARPETQYQQGNVGGQFVGDIVGSYQMIHDGWRGSLYLTKTDGTYQSDSDKKVFPVRVQSIENHKIVFFVMGLGGTDASKGQGQRFEGYLGLQQNLWVDRPRQVRYMKEPVRIE